MSTLAPAALLPKFGTLTPKVAERWVAAALAEAAALHEHDAWLYPHDPARLPVAQSLHDAWRHWVDDAEALVNQIKSLGLTASDIPNFEELRDEVIFTQMMLELTPAEAT